jgi:hypothetical protein
MNRWEQLLKRTGEFFRQASGSWFCPVGDWMSTWMNRLFLPALFLVGLYQWGDFLNWGKIPFQLADWADITAPMLAFLKDAAMRGVLPLHTPQAAALRHATDRFLATPDNILSPQVFLLRFMDAGMFVLLNTLVLYTLAFWGLLLIRRRYRLGLAAFFILFFLFSFNGHIADHLAVGHLWAESYFLLPFFCILVFDLLEGQAGWKWICAMALLFFIFFLQGSLHQFMWCFLFLALLGISARRMLKPVFLALAFAILTSMYRILPTAQVAEQFKIGFLSGFPTVGDLFNGLVTLIEPARALDTRTALTPLLGWYEFDHYTGWIGFFFVVCFGVYFWLKKNPPGSPYLLLALPMTGMTFLSIGRLYKPVFVLGIPMLTGERVTSRFLIVPLVFLFILGANYFQRWLENRHPGAGLQALMLGLMLVLANDLLQHMELWKVDQLESIFPPAPALNPGLWVVTNHPDPAYFLALTVGAVISLLALGFVIYKALRSR